MLVFHPSRGMDVYLNASNPLHIADAYAGVKKVRPSVTVSVTRVKDLDIFTMCSLQCPFIKILELPEVVQK
jgi:hypothetical protein